MTAHTARRPRPGGRHRRHRLVSRERLAADYESRYGSPAVSEYALAVRDVIEQCPEIGRSTPGAGWPSGSAGTDSGRDWATWRKRLSRHFTTETKGPPWQTVVLVVECTVAAADREATLLRFAQLYEAARGERPTSERRRAAVDPAHPDGSALQPPPGPAGAYRVGDDADPVLDALRGENATLKRRLAAREAENSLLRATIEAAKRSAPTAHPRTRPLGGGSRPDDVPRQREAVLPAESVRKDRNPGHFPAGPTPTNDAPAGRHRPPRIDTVSLPDTATTATYWMATRAHAPGGVRR